MPTAELWFKVVQWFTNLDSKKAVLFLLSLIVTALLFENHNLHSENDRLDSRNTFNTHRFDSIRSTLETKLQNCNDNRYKDVQESSKYWSEKYDKLEKQLYEDYKRVNQIKKKR